MVNQIVAENSGEAYSADKSSDAVTAFNASLAHFANTLRDLNIAPDQIAGAIDVLANAQSPVVCSGVGKSGFIASKMTASLNSLGVPAVFLNPTDALHGDLGIVASETVVVLFSNSGTTSELLKILAPIRSRGCRVISVVGTAASPLGQHSDWCIAYGDIVEADEHHLAPTTSTVVQMAIADALSIESSKMRGFRRHQFLENHPAGALGKRLMRVEALMRTGDQLPIVRQGTPLVDALTVMTSKHIGCVCIVDDTLRLCGLLTDGDVRRAIERRVDLYSSTVDSIMQREPQFATVGDMLENLMFQDGFLNRHFTLPVLDHERALKGILVSIDLI